VTGTTGRGIHEHFGMSADEVDIWTGTLSKAIPSTGGFVAADRSIIVYMQHGSAPYIFSAACAPSALAAASAALDVIQGESDRLKQVRRNAERLRDGLRRLGYDTGRSDTHIIPVILGNNQATFRLSVRLFELGIIALPIVSPAVAYGQARLRLCATASQDADFIGGALKAFEVCRKG
jgi:glycine C-acetyltransferase